ncbi:heme exporter protein CcmD [Methyloceanibacter sp.]|uniref:heme exporter protein CcmD n=1 Tax=Methyloceanibacter sp. TaxID=1965321 RepID=UPI002D25006A|nr:heme exporter protein CcmD [Methyloceanibacter sp.]HZP07755.1 heme exporter protein CcmD [Methyloceanibacter sp.]
MPDLGPHAAFIIAAYAATFVAIAALAFFIVEDDRRQRRVLRELEARGVRRRSAAASPEPKRKPAAKPARKARS